MRDLKCPNGCGNNLAAYPLNETHRRGYYIACAVPMNCSGPDVTGVFPTEAEAWECAISQLPTAPQTRVDEVALEDQ